MVSKKLWSFLLAVIVGLATTWILLGAVGMMSPALAHLAQGPQLEANARLDKALPGSAPPSVISVLDVLSGTEPLSIFVDRAGEPVGEGTHQGQLRCKNNCSQETRIGCLGCFRHQQRTSGNKARRLWGIQIRIFRLCQGICRINGKIQGRISYHQQ